MNHQNRRHASKPRIADQRLSELERIATSALATDGSTSNEVRRAPGDQEPKPAFADGGQPKETTEQLMARMAAKYGVAAPASAPTQPVAQPKQQALQPAPKQGIANGILGILGGRKQQLDEQERKAMGYANGGQVRGFSLGGEVNFGDDSIDGLKKRLAAMQSSNMENGGTSVTASFNDANQNKLLDAANGKPDQSALMNQFQAFMQQKSGIAGFANGKSPNPLGAKIKGPGTATSDSIPGVVHETGEPIAVSTEERIVSAEQEKLLGRISEMLGFKTVDAMFEALTGKPVGPTIKGGKLAAAVGLSPEREIQLNTVGDGQPLQTKDIHPGGHQDRGAGIVASRSSSGRLSVSNVGTEKLTDASKGIMDGSASALIDQKNSTYNPARQLANMQRLRLETDAFDPSITDQNVREGARKQLTQMDARAGREGEIVGRTLDNQIKQSKLIGESQMTGLQSNYLNEKDPIRRNEIAQHIRAINGKSEGGPSLGQQSDNIEIDAARRVVDGMSQDEIKRRSANYTATGRENPDYDPMIERAMKLANRRKVGADDHFDQRMQAPQPNQKDDPATRFGVDPAMKGHKMGRVTGQGLEVLDANGKLIGHYR